MNNSMLYILFTLCTLAVVLAAFKLGKSWVYGYVSAAAVLMNIFVLKQMDLFGLSVTGGNVLYSSLFLSTDLLAEHYGKRYALRAVRLGFFVSLFFLMASQFILAFEPNSFDFAQGSLETLFSYTPRIVAASMASYLLSQHLDVHLYELIRKKTAGRFLWLRNNGSTWISQALDSTAFTLLAFLGVFDTKVLLEMTLFTYAMKLLVALMDTPFIYLSKTRWMRPLDLEDSNGAT